MNKILFLENGSMNIIESYDLERLEQAISCISCKFNDQDKELFVVGTAHVVNEELEPSKGRILVFEVTGDQRINLVTEKETKAVYALTSICGKLAAGLGSKVIHGIQIALSNSTAPS